MASLAVIAFATLEFHHIYFVALDLALQTGDDLGPLHGLPLGIQAIAKQADDGLLLQLAAQIERAIDGKWNDGKRPGVHVTRN